VLKSTGCYQPTKLEILQLNKLWNWDHKRTSVPSSNLKGPYNWSLQKPRKMAIIVPRRRRGTWEGVPTATWCSEWICRMWGGLGPHVLIFPTSLSFPPMRGATISRAPTILHDDSFYKNIQSCQISNFVDH
jgi:hypothetical protein